MSTTLEVRLSDDQLEALAEKIAVKMGEATPKRKAPLSVKEASLALNISQSSVRSRIDAGLIRTVPDMEGLTRIPQAEIQRLQGG